MKNLLKNKLLNKRVSKHRGLIEPDISYLQISFKYYKDKLCEIRELEKGNARRFLKDIRNIGKSTIYTLRENNIDSISVSNRGEYTKLFNGLPSYVNELMEHKGNGTSRIFYFCIDTEFNVIAITQNHFETNKNR